MIDVFSVLIQDEKALPARYSSIHDFATKVSFHEVDA